MMDYGLSDAEERQIFGSYEEEYEIDEYDLADDQIKAAKEEPEYYRSIL
tara:strand:- start:442 stop:588 length:147 start_codon:yes stop_codon:yes gene_type:complete